LQANPSEDDAGAALVEFALVLPILLIIMLGIIEFGFALSQQLDVRHGAREASRMVATDDFHFTEACDRMDLSDGAVISLAGAAGAVGDEATVRIQAPVQSVTGFFDGWLPPNLTSEVRVRIEQDPSWANGANTCGP
jgi:Flp pilus assembly protein TadG